jgi:hypothetical protein
MWRGLGLFAAHPWLISLSYDRAEYRAVPSVLVMKRRGEGIP